jgi:hypothetical protein
MQIILFGGDNVHNLANDEDQWNALKSARQTPFVRCLADWDELVSSGGLQGTPLARLSRADLMVFRSHLQFDETSRNGTAYSRGCAGWYHGELVDQFNLSDAELEAVAAIFGISAERYRAAVRDKFGDICNGNVCCRPRLHFNCPDGKPNCTC